MCVKTQHLSTRCGLLGSVLNAKMQGAARLCVCIVLGSWLCTWRWMCDRNSHASCAQRRPTLSVIPFDDSLPCPSPLSGALCAAGWLVPIPLSSSPETHSLRCFRSAHKCAIVRCLELRGGAATIEPGDWQCGRCKKSNFRRRDR